MECDFNVAMLSLLSFRKRAAQRNLLAAGSVGSREGLRHRSRAICDSADRNHRYQSSLNPSREPTLPAASRFLCAARLRNDKRGSIAEFPSGFGSNHEPAVRIDPILFFFSVAQRLRGAKVLSLTAGLHFPKLELHRPIFSEVELRQENMLR